MNGGFNMDTLFTTERLIVSNAKEGEIDTIMSIENHDENKKFIWQGSYEEHLREINDETSMLLTIREKETGYITGYCLVRLSHKFDAFELRRLAIINKGQGFGKEALLGIIKYCFETLEMNRFWLDVYPFNRIGVNLYESIGMYCEGTLRQSYKDERGYHDQIIFSLLKEEYGRS